MNIEIEIKVKIDDIEGVRKKVNNLGKLIKSIDQIDDYYIPCHRDFFAEKPHPVEWLRIRSNPDKTIFEYDRSINKNENGIQEAMVARIMDYYYKTKDDKNIKIWLEKIYLNSLIKSK